MPDLGAKFAVGLPAQRHGFETEQGLGNFSVRRASLRAIERLQGTKVQQRCTGDSPHGLLGWRMAPKNLRLRIERIQLAAQAGAKRNGEGTGRAVDKVISQ